MQALIDTHCHLLANLDDGPASEREAVDLARLLVDSGVKTVVCTPHHSRRWPTKPEQAQWKLDNLRALLVELDIELDTHLAAEVSPASAVTTPLDDLRRLSLGERFLIVEILSDTPERFFSLVHERVASAGLRPIFAHPERSRAVQRRPALLQQAIRHGALVQVVAPSILGRWGPAVEETAWELISSGEVDLLASDAHGRRRSPLDLKHAVDMLGRQFGLSSVVELVRNRPAEIIGLQDPITEARGGEADAGSSDSVAATGPSVGEPASQH